MKIYQLLVHPYQPSVLVFWDKGEERRPRPDQMSENALSDQRHLCLNSEWNRNESFIFYIKFICKRIYYYNVEPLK